MPVERGIGRVLNKDESQVLLARVRYEITIDDDEETVGAGTLRDPHAVARAPSGEIEGRIVEGRRRQKACRSCSFWKMATAAGTACT